MMTHPNAVRATTTKLNPELPDHKSDWQGTPERFPPVLALNEDDQEYHESRGYVAVGKSSPTAFAQMNAVPAPPDYKALEYPKWVNGALVHSLDEELTLMVETDEAAAHAAAPAAASSTRKEKA